MRVSSKRKEEMSEFLRTASSEEIINYLVQYIYLTDTYEKLLQSDRQRIQDLEDKYQISFPKEPVQLATQQLKKAFSIRMASLKEKDE